MLYEDISCNFTKNNNYFLCSFPLNIQYNKIDNQTNTFLLFKGNFIKNNIDVQFKIKSSVIFDSTNDTVFIKKFKILDISISFSDCTTLQNITCSEKPEDIFDINFSEYQNDLEGDIYQEIYRLFKKNTIVINQNNKVTLEMKIRSSFDQLTLKSLSISTIHKNLLYKKYKLLNYNHQFIRNKFKNILLLKDFFNNFTLLLLLILVNTIIISKKIPYKIIKKLSIFS